METVTIKPTGELVLKGIKKIRVGPTWEHAEREALIQLLQSEQNRLEAYEKELRKSVRWEAPYFAENKAKRAQLLEMIFFLGTFKSHQLELNRTNFSDYIE